MLNSSMVYGIKIFKVITNIYLEKLHRMRKSLNFQQGKGNRVTPKKITKAVLTDERFILMKLFESERAWAHAMQLKSESNTEPRKVYHMRSRLKKAVDRANELWELCKWGKCEDHEHVEKCETCGKCDARTYVESQAYYYTMQAVRYFEISEWKKAKSLYEKAYVEYSGLAKAVDKDHEQLYLLKCDELKPLIRYCANNDGDLTESSDLSALHVAGGDLDQFNDLLKQIYKNQVAVMTEVNWLGIVIPVKQDNVRFTILALNDSNKELGKAELNNSAKIAIYDSLLKTCTEALSSVRDDLKGSGPNNPAQITNQSLETMTRLQILFVYLHYVKLTKTVERNLLLIENNRDTSASKPQNMARLYDTVIQNLQEMAGLPGLNRESHDNNAQQEIQAKIASYTAYRCYYLSQAHLLMKRFTECSALLTRTLRHCETALSNLKLISGDSIPGVSVNCLLIPGPVVPEMADKINTLIENIGADQLICRADRCLSMIDDASADTAAPSMDPTTIELPLVRRFDDFIEDHYLSKKTSSQSTGRLISTHPDFEPIPVKPVFFDLAFYHVKFPSLDDKIKDKRGKQSAGKGLTGMVKGWIWGSQ